MLTLVGALKMSWTDWACLAIVVFGFVLFLYGANFYNALVGWLGVYLFIGGILVFLILYIYREMTAKEKVQKP
jgi:membrane-bound ClpP family serine protease